jgi:hypothetical protein
LHMEAFLGKTDLEAVSQRLLSPNSLHHLTRFLRNFLSFFLWAS